MKINGFNIAAIMFLIVAYLFKIDNRMYYFGSNGIKSATISSFLVTVAIICIIVAFIEFILNLFRVEKN